MTNNTSRKTLTDQERELLAVWRQFSPDLQFRIIHLFEVLAEDEPAQGSLNQAWLGVVHAKANVLGKILRQMPPRPPDDNGSVGEFKLKTRKS